MFKHILLPIDGSPVAFKAVKAGIALAKELGAKVTAYYALEPLPQLHYGDSYIVDRGTIKEIEKSAREVGDQHLAKVAKIANASGIDFNSVMTNATTPYIGIVEAAKKQKCDVVFMASHGRSPLSAAVLGSVTQKVLAHSKLPVLVYR